MTSSATHLLPAQTIATTNHSFLSPNLSVMKIAIASGKGGTGKTFVATNLFYALNNKNHNVTLVDCDAEEPNVMVFFSGNASVKKEVTQKVPVIDEKRCTYCSRCHDWCNYNAVFILPPSKVIKVIEELCHGCGACLAACNDEAITEKDIVLGEVRRFVVSEKSAIIEARTRIGVYSPVAVIKAAVREAGNGGVTIFDSPPGTSCPFIHTVTAADYVILVTEPTPFGLSDLKQSVETLKTLNKECGVILNRTGLGDRKVYDYLAEEDIELLMEIPFDREVATLYSKGLLAAANNQVFQERLTSMFNRIKYQYGDSSNQR